MNSAEEKYKKWLAINGFRDCIASRLEFNRTHKDKVELEEHTDEENNN